MNILALATILLAAAENMLPLAIGYLKTPPGAVFLGTVHHPPDYFYYLSQFAQGQYRWATTVNLFTAEPLPPTFVGWSNVLMGRAFALIGLPPVVAYHASVAIFTVILLSFAYGLAFTITRSRTAATVSLYLFALFHAFSVTREGASSYGDYFNNFAVPRVRFGAVPHQLLTALISILIAWCAVAWTRSRNARLLILLAVGSAALASLQPVLWAMMSVTVLVGGQWQLGVVGLSGLVPALYLSRLFQRLPFSQLKSWEALQQTALTPEHFVTATGPVFLLFLFALPAALKQKTFGHRFAAVFSVLSFALFLSPLPKMLGLSHVRFLSTLTVLFVSVIAASGVARLLVSARRPMQATGWLVLIALTLYLLPNHLKTIRLSSDFKAEHAYDYLPQDDYRFFTTASSLLTPADRTLVPWPYHEMFPALTGKHGFHGHPLLTIHSAEKSRAAEDFFAHRLSDADSISFLEKYGITYIIGSANDTIFTQTSWLKPLMHSRGLVLYRVHK